MADREKLPKGNNSPEHSGADLAETVDERPEVLQNKQETAGEHPLGSQERNADDARKEAEAAFNKETAQESIAKGEPDTSAKVSGGVTKVQKRIGYDKTMKSVRTQLTKTESAFSGVIHQPSVEKVSEAVGVSVARPNAILAGSFTAFVAVTVVYILARYNGFELSGFETMAAFIIGWIVGILIDLVRVAFRRRAF